MSSIDHIPIVDFGKYALHVKDTDEEDKRQIGEELYEAFAKAGFVYIKNSGVTEEQIQNIREISKKFFDLDEITKGKYIYNEEFFGYLGNEKERVSPKWPGDLKESYDVNGHGYESDPSRWPDEEVPGFSEKTRHFSDTCKGLALRVLEVLGIGMDIKDKELFMRCHSESMEIKPNQARLAEHSDFGSITLVFQDGVGGLQVQKYDGTYIDATPIPGTVIVNIGDFLEYWTQGKLKATKHRIILLPEDLKKQSLTERLSIIYFAKPNDDTMLHEIDYGTNHVNHGAPVSTAPHAVMTAGEYSRKRFHEMYAL